MTRLAPQWLQQLSYPAALDRQLIRALWPAPAIEGGAVTPAPAGLAVVVAPGQVAVPTANHTGSILCSWDAAEQLALAPAGSSGRVDLVVVRPRGNDIGGGTDNDFVIEAITGTGPSTPATPAGAVALARVAVAAGAAQLAAGDVVDERPEQALHVPSPTGIVLPAQPPVFRAVGAFAYQAAAQAIVIPVPPGVQAGDLLIAFGTNPSAVVQAPAGGGWYAVPQPATPVGNAYFFARIAGTAEPASYSFPAYLGGTYGVMLAYSRGMIGPTGGASSATAPGLARWPGLVGVGLEWFFSGYPLGAISTNPNNAVVRLPFRNVAPDLVVVEYPLTGMTTTPGPPPSTTGTTIAAQAPSQTAAVAFALV